MTRNMNPPIPGHKLLLEGRRWPLINPDTEDYYPEGHPLQWEGGCQCGARPVGWPDLSVGAVKRWHREHKARIRRVAQLVADGHVAP